MRRGLACCIGWALLLGVSICPAQPPKADDEATWRVAKIAKRNRVRSEDASPSAGAQLKYLHVELRFGGQSEPDVLHKFRVVTAHGEQVGELWGYSDAKSLLVFEGDWTTLAGLYLDGLGHREPLFRAGPASGGLEASEAAASAAERPNPPAGAPANSSAVRIGNVAGDDLRPLPGRRLAVTSSGPVSRGVDEAEASARASTARSGATAGSDSASSGAGRTMPAAGSRAGSSTGSGAGVGSGSGSTTGESVGDGLVTGVGSGGVARLRTPPSAVQRVVAPPTLVLYLSCGEESGRGQVFQVDEDGRVLGVVNLPFLATGLALHRNNALIAVTPRDGGHIYRIDDTGRVSVVTERDRELPHPVDVGVAGDSDALVVADNLAHALLTTSTVGDKAESYRQFKRPRWDDEIMSVAVTRDKYVLFGGNNDPGVFRFPGDDGSASRAPLLAGAGGVAADPASFRWAATQEPNQVCVFEGEQLLKRLLLPSSKRVYRQGLLSFAPAGALVVATRDADQAEGPPWLLVYQAETEKDVLGNNARILFQWERARLVDFVVGPRMRWDRNSRPTYRPVY